MADGGEIQVNVKANLVSVMGEGSVVHWDGNYWDLVLLRKGSSLVDMMRSEETVDIHLTLRRQMDEDEYEKIRRAAFERKGDSSGE